MKHLKKSSLLAFLMILAMFFAVSCDVAQEENYTDNITQEENNTDNSETSVFVNVPDNLIGTWEFNGQWTESYTITKDSFTNGYYAGNNAKVYKTDEKSCYIYIQYTKAMNADLTYSETAPDVGKWYAIAYKELTDSTLKLAGAYKKGGKTATATIEEAKAEFTVDNGYFDFYSELTKKYNSETSVFVNVPDNLIGTWEFNGQWTESYTITKDSFTNGYYAGNNAKVYKTDEKSCYIYIQYTKAMNADLTYSETAPDVGKWYAIAYKELTDSTLKLAGAYKTDGKSATSTIEEAKSEFTIENGYFGTYSELEKK